MSSTLASAALVMLHVAWCIVWRVINLSITVDVIDTGFCCAGHVTCGLVHCLESRQPFYHC